MNYREAIEILKNEYPELVDLGVYSVAFEYNKNATLNTALNRYYEILNRALNEGKISSISTVLNTVIDSIDRLLLKYQDDRDTINLLCEEMVSSYYYYRDFESGEDLLKYIRKYLVERLQME